MPTALFVPSSQHIASTPRVDAARDIHDVLATVTLQGRSETKLVIGLDEGRVLRVVAMPADLGSRARAQLDFHEKKRPWQAIRADELYVFDVQAVEKQPDAPGADDPLFLYGVLRGPYPAGLETGVEGIEGQLAATRGELLDGLALGVGRGMLYEHGRCGTTCTHAALPIDVPNDRARSVVLAFPLVPMGDDGSNELVAAQVIHDVLGAMRVDLGDDLSNDPVPVPNRGAYERDLTSAGWTIKGDVAVHSGGKSRLASLFTPGKKQKLPKQVSLAEYVPLINTHLARLPGWPEPARSNLHSRLGIRPVRAHQPTPAMGMPIPPRQRPPTEPPPIPPPRPRTPTPQFAPPAPPPPPLFTPRNRPPTPPPVPRGRKTGPRTVMPGLTAPSPKEWIRQLIDDHSPPDRARSRVVTPGRAAGASVPDWMLDMIDTEFPDDDDKK